MSALKSTNRPLGRKNSILAEVWLVQKRGRLISAGKPIYACF